MEKGDKVPNRPLRDEADPARKTEGDPGAAQHSGRVGERTSKGAGRGVAGRPLRDEADFARTKERARKERWAYPVYARVRTQFGTVKVPCASPFAAVLCAAEQLGVDWTDIRGAKVERLENK